jgi:hypothetical protein
MQPDTISQTLDHPQGTHEQKFALMLQERIIKLEQDMSEQKTLNETLVAGLTARIAELEIQGYDAGTDRFTHGGMVDWFVRGADCPP